MRFVDDLAYVSPPSAAACTLERQKLPDCSLMPKRQ